MEPVHCHTSHPASSIQGSLGRTCCQASRDVQGKLPSLQPAPERLCWSPARLQSALAGPVGHVRDAGAEPGGWRDPGDDSALPPGAASDILPPRQPQPGWHPRTAGAGPCRGLQCPAAPDRPLEHHQQTQIPACLPAQPEPGAAAGAATRKPALSAAGRDRLTGPACHTELSVPG